MTGFSVEGKRVVVVGAARSGVAAADLLVRRGAQVVLTDLKPALPPETTARLTGVALELGSHRTDTLRGADLVVLSPGVPVQQPDVAEARRAGVEVIGEIELASRWLRGRTIAVTGTKGKSTTTTLVGRMLEAAGRRAPVGGNIGTPLSAQVEDSTPETLHVVEVSSFQLQATTSFHPWVAALLNFSPDHLDRHSSVDEYAAAKLRVFANQQADDWAVINADDASVLAMTQDLRARCLGYALDAPLDEGVVLSERDIVYRSPAGEEPLVPVSAVKLVGRHLLSDVAAAAAIARIGGATPEAMTRAVEGFTGLEQALELAGEVSGVRFYNDSKATNVASARRAIESFERNVVIILGGRFKGGDLSELRDPVRARGRAVVAIGEARPLLRAALDGVVPFVEAGSMADAVRIAFAAARPDAIVLLAPACASFDMFADYAERGRVFKQEVARLTEEWRAG